MFSLINSLRTHVINYLAWTRIPGINKYHAAGDGFYTVCADVIRVGVRTRLMRVVFSHMGLRV